MTDDAPKSTDSASERGRSMAPVFAPGALPLAFARPAVLDAIPVDGHVVIEASAGTGKTFALQHLVADLVLGGTPLDEILVVTFTEKATREMRSRVRTTLAGVARRAGLSEEARVRLTEAVLEFDRAPLFTIHGFCQRVLSEHALRTRQPIRHVLVEPRRVFGRAFRDELRVVLAADSPLRRVVTRVLEDMDGTRLEGALFGWHTERGIAQPAWDRARFGSVLRTLRAADLDDEAAVRDVIARRDVAARVLDQLEGLRKIARAFEKDANDLNALVALDRWGRTDAVRGEPARRWLPARLEPLPELHGRVASLLDASTSPFGVLVHELLPRVRTRLDHEKRRRGEIDFDDMLVRVRDVLMDERTGPPLVRALRQQYRHALVDEFQDTDSVQWDIFHRLFVDPRVAAESAGPDHSGSGRLFVIGDPKQAIYGFRNADVHTYRGACDTLQAGRPPVVLDTSFRSTEPLLELLNDVFENDFFEGPIQHGRRVHCGHPDARLVDAHGNDAPPLVLWTPVAPEEAPRVGTVREGLAERIATEIRAIVDEPLLIGRPGAMRPITFGDVFVLTRNAREAEPVAAALGRAGIPHVVHRQDGLFETDEVRDVLDVLRAVAQPDDASARLRAWLTPFFGVGLESLEAAAAVGPQHPLVTRLHALREHARKGDGFALLSALLEESGLSRRLLFCQSSERSLATYRQVLEVLLEESGGRADAADLVARLEAFIEGRAAPMAGEGGLRVDGERTAVQVLTKHRSKGLEAAVVFIAGGFTRGGGGDTLEPSVCHRDGQREAWLQPVPSSIATLIEAEARQEDQRLLYVALTRARARLYVPYCGEPPGGAELPAGTAGFEKLTGPLVQLDQRLRDLLPIWQGAGRPVRWEPVVVRDAPRVASGAMPEAPPDVAFEPPPEADAQFAALRRDHAGFVLTSYSRLKSRGGGYVAPLAEDVDDALDRMDLVEPALLETEDAAIELPGGPSMGVFLHGVLEDLSFRTLREAVDLESWGGRPEVERTFAHHANREKIDAEHMVAAKSLIFGSMRRPVHEGPVVLPGGFASLDAVVKEMSFHFPVPEPWHPRLRTSADAAAPGMSYRIGRGVIRGFVDAIFRTGERYYWLDWKSDRLPRFDAASLDAHVDANYAVQARLYTLGVLRWLRIDSEAAYEQRFGGLVYAFLRGMDAPPGAHSGIVARRPTWSEVVDWERELRESDAPWGYPLEVPGALEEVPR